MDAELLPQVVKPSVRTPIKLGEQTLPSSASAVPEVAPDVAPSPDVAPARVAPGITPSPGRDLPAPFERPTRPPAISPEGDPDEKHETCVDPGHLRSMIG